MRLKFPVREPKHSLVRFRVPATLVAAAALALCGASTAFADSSTSSNWAGYAVHRSGVRFRSISATWRQPNAACRAGHETYSAVWVGLGGYSQNSNALEQIGTEVDCSLSGRVLSSAWYELVPAPSESINLRVRPADAMAASVTVVGHRVDLKLSDLTRHTAFNKSFAAASIDVTSAEWIVEAPSDCTTATSCQTLPLANFGTTGFSSATARSISGVTGAISSHAWGTTSITLSPGGRRYVTYRGSGPSAGAAKPSKLSSGGSGFSVNYATVSVGSKPFFSPRRAASAGSLVHPGR
jgi:hypothetical protein